MKALVCKKPGVLEYEDRPKPLLSEGQAIIRVERVGICGTDLHAFEGTQPFFSYPRILGHELSGELMEFDGTGSFKKGDKVTFVPYFPCGSCIACRMGNINCCVNIKGAGVHIDGGMTELISVPAKSIVKGDGLDPDLLALVEPFSVSTHAVNRADIQKGEYVLVTGAGPIGLAAMEMAGIAGGKVIAMEIMEQRLAFCRDVLRLKHVVNASENPEEKIKEITGGDWPTVIIDATGSKNTIMKSFNMLAHGGRIVMLGIQREEICFSHPEFHKRETTLMSSRNAFKPQFEYVVKCMGDNMLRASSYITHRTKFTRLKDEFRRWLDPKTGVIKAMVEMDL
ncbi:MAG TPA: zinc-binding alcohol dehydrogenase family protein [Bacteroidales bacterium]|nr:zinc-binding alcohol dehydrogenase family protein [Bacteroidales bacterium]